MTQYQQKSKFKEMIKNSKFQTSQIPPLNQDYKLLLEAIKPVQDVYLNKTRESEKNGSYKLALINASKAYALTGDELVKDYIFELLQKTHDIPAPSDEIKDMITKAQVLTDEKEQFRALAEYNKVLKSAPYLSEIYYKAALIYAQLKDYKNAVSYIKDYIKTNPDDPDMKKIKKQMINWEILGSEEQQKYSFYRFQSFVYGTGQICRVALPLFCH